MNKQEQIRQETIQRIASMLEETPFTFQYKVAKDPQGIIITYEVTQQEMNALVASQVDSDAINSALKRISTTLRSIRR